MVLTRLIRNSLLLLSLAGSAMSGEVWGQCMPHNQEIIKAGVLRFFGKEQLVIMQRRTFGFDIIYGRQGGAVTVEVQRIGKQKWLSDTVAAVLTQYLDQEAALHLCKGNPGKVRIDEHTSFEGIKAEHHPLITPNTVPANAWNDTLKRHMARYRELYPGDCGQLRCVRGLSYKVLPLQRPGISSIIYAGCDTAAAAAAFLLRLRTFLEGRLALPYPVTTEGCVADYLYEEAQAPVAEEDRVWCMVNFFGYARYFVFKLPAADCD